MNRININRYRIPILLVFFLITVLFAWTFAYSPFSEMVNSIILNGGTVLSALIAAVIFGAKVRPMCWSR